MSTKDDLQAALLRSLYTGASLMETLELLVGKRLAWKHFRAINKAFDTWKLKDRIELKPAKPKGRKKRGK